MPDTWVDLPFAEARDFLIAKGVVTREQFDALTAEERLKAFTVTGVNRLDVLQHILDSVTEAVAEGTTLADFANDLDEVLSTAGLDPVSPWRAETIFRTSVQSAYGRGRFEQMTDPDIASEVWGWTYRTVEDDRVRDEHAALDGHAFATGEGEEFFPPWDFNCRCSSEIILNDEAAAAGLTSGGLVPPESQAALAGSSFTSPAVSYAYTPDLSGFEPALAGAFVRETQQEFGG
jgi:SPP1 gp7 family putative phage head morphogenesis protein